MRLSILRAFCNLIFVYYCTYIIYLLLAGWRIHEDLSRHLRHYFTLAGSIRVQAYNV